MLNLLVLIFGFGLLIKGADIFVDGSSSVATRFKVPAMIIGLTIVAMGTSAPELAVSMTSSLAGQNDMSVANVVGSNMFNILIVLGMSSLLRPLPVKKETIRKDMPFLIYISIFLLLIGHNAVIDFKEGLCMLALFIWFIHSTIRSAKAHPEENTNEEYKQMSILKTIAYILCGIGFIILGSDMVVDSATKIASLLGMSENLIGLTIVAFGTSLPELVTSVVATKKGEVELAIGNVIGSNIFNILFILGTVSVINPIAVSTLALIDIGASITISALLYESIRHNDNKISRDQGLFFILIYVVYIMYTIMR